MVDWRIYYAGGATYSSADGPPEAAPFWGVLVIVQPDDTVGRTMIMMCDWYWFDAGHWWGGDDTGYYDYLARLGTKIIKVGRTVSNAEWRATYQRANDDQDFPKKSGRVTGEKKP